MRIFYFPIRSWICALVEKAIVGTYRHTLQLFQVFPFSLCCFLCILHTWSDLLCKTCQQCPWYPLIHEPHLLYPPIVPHIRTKPFPSINHSTKSRPLTKRSFSRHPLQPSTSPTLKILTPLSPASIPQPHPPQQSRPLIFFSMRLDTSPGSFLGTLGVGVFIIIAFAALVLLVVIYVLIFKLIGRCKRKRAETSKV